MAGLTRQQMIATWKGLKGLTSGLPSDSVPTGDIEGLSDAALTQRITSMQVGIDRGAPVRRAGNAFDPNGRVPVLNAPPASPQTAREAAIKTLRDGITNPSQVDAGQFHSIIAAYSDGQKYTIPDLAFDRTITDAEKKAAEEIAKRLEAGENAPAIRQAFGTQANTIQEQQRIAAQTAAREAAEAQARARAQQNIHTAVDSHFAALGLIKPEQIGSLTVQQRANYLTRFIQDNHIALQREGSPSFAIGNITKQQTTAIDMTNGYGVNSNALVILQSGRQGTHMAEEVRAWMESRDPKQIMMAQSTLGVQVTGEIDAATHASASRYIQQPYATKLEDLSFIQNGNKTFNPTLMAEAANAGRLYIPSTDAELRAAGFTDDQIAALEGTKPAGEIVPARAALQNKPHNQFTDADRAVWVSDTREEIIASMYLENPALYTKAIEARNAMAANATLGVTAPTPAAQQEQFLQNYAAIPQTRITETGALVTGNGQAIPENLPPGVREMLDAKRLVETTEAELQRVTNQVGGMRTDPLTGREVLFDVAQEKIKATRAVDTAYAGYDATEQALRANGTFDQVMAYIDQLNKGQTPTIQITPRGTPSEQRPPAGDTAPAISERSGEPQRVSSLFTAPAERGGIRIDSIRPSFGSAVDGPADNDPESVQGLTPLRRQLTGQTLGIG